MMDIFISWSGPRSGALAEALKRWLPKIVNAFKPWLSSADIDRGARWSSEVASKLAASKASIICLTPNNLNAPWILFEAGALSKTLENTFVCPLLVGLEPSDVTGPLAQFQASKVTNDHILSLLKTLNRALGESAMPEQHIDEAFEVWWPKLAAEIEALPPDGQTTRPHRTDRELLEELVNTVRSTSIDDGVLQSQIGQTVADISTRLSAIESRLPPFVNLEPSRLRTLSQLLGTATLGGEAKTGYTTEPVGSDTHPIRKLRNREAKARSGIDLSRAEKDGKKD
jgi:hypothetical protein